METKLLRRHNCQPECSQLFRYEGWVGEGLMEEGGNHNFSLSNDRVMLINSPTYFIAELKIHHL